MCTHSLALIGLALRRPGVARPDLVFTWVQIVSHGVKKETTIARSRAEAEYRSIASAATELTWITFLLHDLGIPIHQRPTLLCDNLNVVYMTKNPAFHARTKHIELDFHFVREKVSPGLLITTHIFCQASCRYFLPSH